MRIIAELAGGLMLLAIFGIGMVSIIKEINRTSPQPQEKPEDGKVGNVSGRDAH